MYDPTIGRFITADPTGFEAGDANLYRYVRNGPTNATDPSGMLECDDRENAPGNSRLVDVDTVLMNRINSVINTARAGARAAANALGLRPGAPLTPTQRAQLASIARAYVYAVYVQLGQDRPGTGVDTGAGSYGQVTEIEAWLKDNLRSPNHQINQVRFWESRYARSETGFGVRNPYGNPYPLWLTMRNQAIQNHGIAPTIRVSGVLMGTDKWGHFFQQGYWLFDAIYRGSLGIREAYLEKNEAIAFCAYLEGGYDRSAAPAGQEARFAAIARRWGTSSGMQGMLASGVASGADIAANVQGLNFYATLYADFIAGADRFQFRLADYNLRILSESRGGMPMYYLPGKVRVDDAYQAREPPAPFIYGNLDRGGQQAWARYWQMVQDISRERGGDTGWLPR